MCVCGCMVSDRLGECLTSARVKGAAMAVTGKAGRQRGQNGLEVASALRLQLRFGVSVCPAAHRGNMERLQ